MTILRALYVALVLSLAAVLVRAIGGPVALWSALQRAARVWATYAGHLWSTRARARGRETARAATMPAPGAAVSLTSDGRVTPAAGGISDRTRVAMGGQVIGTIREETPTGWDRASIRRAGLDRYR